MIEKWFSLSQKHVEISINFPWLPAQVDVVWKILDNLFIFFFSDLVGFGGISNADASLWRLWDGQLIVFTAFQMKLEICDIGCSINVTVKTMGTFCAYPSSLKSSKCDHSVYYIHYILKYKSCPSLVTGRRYNDFV